MPQRLGEVSVRQAGTHDAGLGPIARAAWRIRVAPDYTGHDALTRDAARGSLRKSADEVRRAVCIRRACARAAISGRQHRGLADAVRFWADRLALHRDIRWVARGLPVVGRHGRGGAKASRQLFIPSGLAHVVHAGRDIAHPYELRGAAAGVMRPHRAVCIGVAEPIVGRDRIGEAPARIVGHAGVDVPSTDRPAYNRAAAGRRPVERKVLAGWRFRWGAERGRRAGIQVRAHRRDVLPGWTARLVLAHKTCAASRGRPLAAVPHLAHPRGGDRRGRDTRTGGTWRLLAGVAVAAAQRVVDWNLLIVRAPDRDKRQ